MIGRRTGFAALLLLASTTASVALGQVAVSAHPASHAAHHKTPNHIGPTRTAWFDTTRATAAAPGLPQPGVQPGDLVVDGVTITTGQLPVAVPIKVPTMSQVTALSALSYRLPKGATAGTLSLKLSGLTTATVDGKLPGGVVPTACPISTPFKKGSQQVGSAAPNYDCKKRSAIGQLSASKKAIEFPGIGRLAHGRTLSFVIVPGTIGLERLVFTKPGKTSLQILSFGEKPPPTPTPLPSTTSTSAPTSGSTGNPPPPVSTGAGSTGALPPIGKVTNPKGYGATPPQVAGSSAPTPAARVTAAKPLDDKRARAAALALLVGLVVLTLWLSATDRGARTISTLRLLRAIQAGGPLPEVPATEWGVGRFKSARSGPPPTI